METELRNYTASQLIISAWKYPCIEFPCGRKWNFPLTITNVLEWIKNIEWLYSLFCLLSAEKSFGSDGKDGMKN